MAIVLRLVKGSPLTNAELDGNFTDLDDRVTDLEDNPPSPVEIASISQTGASFTVHMSDASTFGPFTIPTQTPAPPAVVAVTGTTRTLAAADASTYMRCTNAAGCAVTVPPNASVSITTGSEFHFVQRGAVGVSFVAGSGVTINAPTGFDLETDLVGAVVTLKKVATNEWDLFGNLAAA